MTTRAALAPLLVILAGVLAGCAAGSEEDPSEEGKADLSSDATCTPFKLAEAGAKRGLTHDVSTCESPAIWGGYYYTVLDHLAAAKKSCSGITEKIKSSATLRSFMATDLEYYVATGDVVGKNLDGLEDVFAAHKITLWDNDTFTTEFHFATNGTGTSTDSKTKKTTSFTYQVTRQSGAISLELASAGKEPTSYRLGLDLNGSALTIDGLATEVGGSDLCSSRVTCPASGSDPCVAR